MRYQLPRGYRRYLLGLAMLALLCIAAAVTVFFVPVQKQQPQAQYLLKDNAGRLALYTPDGTGPLAQYDVYTRLLPEPDCLALQQGVFVILFVISSGPAANTLQNRDNGYSFFG